MTDIRIPRPSEAALPTQTQTQTQEDPAVTQTPKRHSEKQVKRCSCIDCVEARRPSVIRAQRQAAEAAADALLREDGFFSEDEDSLTRANIARTEQADRTFVDTVARLIHRSGVALPTSTTADQAYTLLMEASAEFARAKVPTYAERKQATARAEKIRVRTRTVKTSGRPSAEAKQVIAQRKRAEAISAGTESVTPTNAFPNYCEPTRSVHQPTPVFPHSVRPVYTVVFEPNYSAPVPSDYTAFLRLAFQPTRDIRLTH